MQAEVCEVFHWRVDPKASGDPEVSGAMAQLFMGHASQVKRLLDNHESWAAKGLSLVKVADVATDNLDNAYTLTNHIMGSWCANQGVTVAGGKKQRSTMVGDVISNNGAYHVIANVGFEPITIPEAMIKGWLDAEKLQPSPMKMSNP